MNIDTGDIRYLAFDQSPTSREIALTHGEARYLQRRPAKERMVALKRLRKRLIRVVKRQTGRRLTQDELQAVLAPFKVK